MCALHGTHGSELARLLPLHPVPLLLSELVVPEVGDHDRLRSRAWIVALAFDILARGGGEMVDKLAAQFLVLSILRFEEIVDGDLVELLLSELILLVDKVLPVA